MNQALFSSLTDTERLFVAETSPDALAALDEDQVLDLHTRARRLRDKYVKNYRRAAAGAVATRGGRGLSYEKNQRDRGKAEIFETALARVSRRLGTLAARSAAELKTERLAAARSDGSGPAVAAAPPAPEPASRPRGVRKTTGGVKKDASTRSMGSRRQAKRDSR
ncbi:MAG: hypothetical protein HOQ45_14145 [Nocardioidaceae bacterium]|nr:hypothetical protein [Nocardioidaceae bacterium]